MKQYQATVSALPASNHNASLYFSILLLPLMCNLFATGWPQSTTTTVLWRFVQDYPGEPVPEETLTHPPS